MLMMTFPVFGAVGAAAVALIAVIGLLVKRHVALTPEQEYGDLRYRLAHPVKAAILHPVKAIRRRMVSR